MIGLQLFFVVSEVFDLLAELFNHLSESTLLLLLLHLAYLFFRLCLLDSHLGVQQLLL